MTVTNPQTLPSWATPEYEGDPARFATEKHSVEISVVLPCLNEENTVGDCVTSIQEVLDPTGVTYEVIVVDNGSADRSAERARAVGARVIHEPVAGYGRACRAGLDEAKGGVLVLGDSDGTYDFSVVPQLAALLEDGAELALGNRLKGEMESGAMPWMHRRLGTPLLTGVVNFLFRTGIGDVNCGIRAISRSAYLRLNVGSDGMEFASELVVRTVQHGFTVTEIPVDYRRRRSGEAKLRTWVDGWRHLRLVTGSWLSHGRRVAPAAPLIALPVATDLLIDLNESEESDADRFRL